MGDKLFKIMLFVLFTVGCGQKEECLRLVSFNVRYHNSHDGMNIWERRIPIIEAYLTIEAPDIIGMQEPWQNQIVGLQEILPDYAFVGTGRIDGEQEAEFSPIFYRKDKFELIENSQFWLSETPEVPGSIGWDAALSRIVTWAKLEHKPSGKNIFVFNTHFDHRGIEARERSIMLMSEKMSEIAGNAPLVAMGDYNISKGRPELYEFLLNTFDNNNSLSNSEHIASIVYSPGATFNGFNLDWKAASSTSDAIDFIFVNDHFRVDAYRVDQVMKGDVFISDHWPVFSKISLNK